MSHLTFYISEISLQQSDHQVAKAIFLPEEIFKAPYLCLFLGKKAFQTWREMPAYLPDAWRALMSTQMPIDLCFRGNVGFPCKKKSFVRLRWARLWPWQRLGECEKNKKRQKVGGGLGSRDFRGWYLWHRREKSMGIMVISIWIKFHQQEKYGWVQSLLFGISGVHEQIYAC